MDDAQEASSPSSRLRERRSLGSKRLSVICDTPAEDAAGSDWLPRQLTSEYEVLEVLGTGSAGVVRRGIRRSDGSEVALKTVRAPDLEQLGMVQKEYNVLRSLKHPNIVRAWDFLPLANSAVVVVELFLGEELDTAVRRAPGRRLSEATSQLLFKQLLQAVSYLHELRILHRDIKGPNVLVDADLVALKLVDFNTACCLAEGASLTMTGTLDYAAPEVLLGESPSDSADVWSAGLCLHVMLAGRLPRRMDKYPSLAEFAQAASRPMHLQGRRFWEEASDGCRRVLQRSLQVDKFQRPAAITLLTQEPWLSDGTRRMRAREASCSSDRSTSCGSVSPTRTRRSLSGNPGRRQENTRRTLRSCSL